MSGSQIGVYIVSENRLLRESLARILNKRSDLWALGAQDLNMATVKSILDSDARVLLFDSANHILSNSDVTHSLFSDGSSRKTVLVSMEEDETLFLETIRRGVTGYLLKDASAVDVVSTVRAVSQGDVICPPCLCRILFQFVARGSAPAPAIKMRPSRVDATRAATRSIIARGLTNKEIAAFLNLSEQTVKNHIHHILHKVARRRPARCPGRMPYAGA